MKKVIDQQREKDRFELEQKYKQRGLELEHAFKKRRDDIEEKLGLIYQREEKVEEGRTNEIELEPVESYVVDTEKQQQLMDEKKASAASLLKGEKRAKSKGILTNARSDKKQHASIDAKPAHGKKISFKTASPMANGKKYKRQRIKSF